jgi:hypothetical protein
MRSTHTRRARALALALAVASLLPIGAGAGAAEYQALGRYDDPVGDVAIPEGDLQQLQVRYFDPEAGQPAAVLGVLDAVAAIDPANDPGWAQEGTGASLALSVDGDAVPDAVLTAVWDGDELAVAVLDGDGDPITGCDPLAVVFGSGNLGLQLGDAACIGAPTDVRAAAALSFQPSASATTQVDRVPDGDLQAPVPRGDAPAVCDNATVERSVQLAIRRLACGGTLSGTEPIRQAIATSQFAFDDAATDAIDPYLADYAIIARDDDFADALTGSALSFGQGTLLFTRSPASAAATGEPAGSLHPLTRQELLRSTPRGRTVYLLGGATALDPGLDAELEDLGYAVRRLAGESREGTARLVSQEVDRIVAEFSTSTGFPDTNMVLVATRSNWPDAVVAGSVGAFWGMPVLLVANTLPVHPETLAALDELRPDYIHIIGGRTVVPSDVGQFIGQHARDRGYGLGRPGEDLTSPRWRSFCGAEFICRWGRDTRIQTAAAVSQLNRDMVNRFGELTPLVPDNPQQYAAGINLSSSGPNYAYALAAAMVSGRFGGAVFIPTEDGTLSPDTVAGLCDTPGSERFIELVEEFVLIGDTDVLPQAFPNAVRDLVEQGCDNFAG